MLIRKILTVLVVSSMASFVNGDIFEWRDYDQDGDPNSLLSGYEVMDGVDLSGQWLLGAEMRGHGLLEGLDLSYAKLMGSVWGSQYLGIDHGSTTNFEWSDATYTRFIGANMKRGEYNNNNFSHANFTRAKLFGVNMENSNFYHANLTDMNNSSWQRNARNGSYSNSDFTLANFDYSDFRGSRFDGAIFNSADFLSANFEGALFLGADLSGSINWETANWTGAKYNDNTIFADGMDPTALGMMNVPAPGVLAILGLAGVTIRRRRS